MPNFICDTCGTEHAESSGPPSQCRVCEDERQYVGWSGQRWTTHTALNTKYRQRIEDDGGLLGVGMTPGFAINQRALLLPTDAGNILWECVSLVSSEALETLKARGGIDWIVVSHPHFYTSMLTWSDALGGVPILLHEADKSWVQGRSRHVQFWSGDRLALSPDVTLLRLGGHFPGSTGLHWKTGPREGGALFPGDAVQVAQDRRHVSCMYSYPNMMPMRPADVKYIRSMLEGLAFDDVFGFTWGRNVIGGAREAVDVSLDRYLSAVAA